MKSVKPAGHPVSTPIGQETEPSVIAVLKRTMSGFLELSEPAHEEVFRAGYVGEDRHHKAPSENREPCEEEDECGANHPAAVAQVSVINEAFREQLDRNFLIWIDGLGLGLSWRVREDLVEECGFPNPGSLFSLLVLNLFLRFGAKLLQGIISAFLECDKVCRSGREVAVVHVTTI